VTNRFLATIRLVLDAARRGGFRVALIGGFALPFHGIRRATGDVDFLVEAGGADALDGDLLAAGFRRLHRSDDSANYAASCPDYAAVDLLLARRAPSLDMLARADRHRMAQDGLEVPVVDVEGIIGLKVQAIANDPRRRRRDAEDIVTLLAAHPEGLDLPLLEHYFELFEMRDELTALLEEARTRR